MDRWDESEHPRDGRGRFAEKRGGDWASAASDQIAGRRYPKVDGRDLFADGWVDEHRTQLAAAVEDWEAARWPYGDPVIARIASKQGFDGKPAVGSPDELDAAVAGGGIQIWRGYSNWYDASTKQFVEGDGVIRKAQADWREGEYRAGNGLYGQGTYASVDSLAATRFSRHNNWEDDEGGRVPWSVQRMVLSPEARIVDWDDPQLERFAGFRSDASDGWDRGRAAAALGFDAMRVTEGNDDGTGQDLDQYVIFNRTALMVEQERREDYLEWS